MMTTPAAVLRIYEIIRADVCGRCEVENIPRDCNRHKRRCEAGYRRQAQAIYEQVVKPMEANQEGAARTIPVEELP